MKYSILFSRDREVNFNVLLVFFFLAFLTACGSTSESGKKLEQGFLNPPDVARPRVWWHWMNGNITKEGIRADLEWMHRTGIRGFQNFDASLMTPQIVKKRLIYMTPEWKDAFLFTTKLADSLGMEMAIAGSPGWSESGGPWVQPSQAMKKYVWSQVAIDGGKLFNGKLPRPPSTTGPFQNIGPREVFSLSPEKQPPEPEFYSDAAVIAYRVPNGEASEGKPDPAVTSSGGKFTLSMLTDGDLSTSVLLPSTKPGEKAWIQFDFSKPETIHGLTIVGGGYPGMWGMGADPDNRALEAGDDGKTFTEVIKIPPRGVEQRTLSFKPVTARYFRFTWKTPQPAPALSLGSTFGIDDSSLPKPPQGTKVAELVLHRFPQVNGFEEKAAFAAASDLYRFPTPSAPQEGVIGKTDVIDLTSLMKSDGTLEWTPPEGRWIIVRLGYSLTGHKNGPASPEATGLEVDKLNADHVRAYFTNYLDQYKDATGGLMGENGLKYVVTDSWEAGLQNWTDNMMSEFKRRRGYDMVPWLPVLTGMVVESSESSDRFLWDFRKTLAELVVENHYDLLSEILKERGMGRYTESHESGRALIADGMDVKRKADIPMSATWTPGGFDDNAEVSTGYKADVRESASVAHIYGQNIVAAESMTAIGTAWAWSPETLKPTADMELSNGLNRFVIHTSVHQPVNDKIPGLGLGPFGQWFTRHETWAGVAYPWIDYLSRSSYMLQQGRFVADIAYYYGEDNNITSLFVNKLPEIPAGYSYDFVNADALINLFSVENGELTVPSGMKYSLLVLDSNSIYMTLPVLRKIKSLFDSGAKISGPKPVSSPSLCDGKTEFDSIVNQVWGNGKESEKPGSGRIFSGIPISEVLKESGIGPDFEYKKQMDDTRVLFVHRRIEDIDIYWINNRRDRDEEIEAFFRVHGSAPEIWHPQTGRIEKVSYSVENGITKVQLQLNPHDALFVVFRNKTRKNMEVIPPKKENVLATVDGEWELLFQKERGAPENTGLKELKSWTDFPEPGIRYFSGTGTYKKIIDVDESWLEKDSEIIIDLGDVKNIAEVLLNGEPAGIAWKKPFRIDLTGRLKAGSNNLEIRVTNLWVNRLIGDMQPGVSGKITYTTMPFYRPDSPLKPSGLLGPVTILSVTNK